MNDMNTESMLRVGTILHGTYCIESYLASGGFGNTYLARNIQFEEKVAIKEFFVRGVCERDDNSASISVSNSDNTNSFSQQLEKFKKEARRLRSLNNPHIVKVYDLFEENGTAYYVMDYVDGESLASILKKTHAPLPESLVRDCLLQVLDGLEAIHQADMLHLDLKPANMMVDSHHQVKLIDFGASKQQSSSGGATASTGICYTNGYAPSEQMAQSYEKFGPWTDFYALGATVFNLLTNQDPPSVSDLSEDESLYKHDSLPMPNVSEEMKNLVIWMMQVNRNNRPKSAAEIRERMNAGGNDDCRDNGTAYMGKTNKGNGGYSSPNGSGKGGGKGFPVTKSLLIFLFVLIVLGFLFLSTCEGGSSSSSDDNDTELVSDGESESEGADDEGEKRNGYDEVKYDDGSTYKGGFKDGLFEGDGVLEWPEERSGYIYKYVGEFVAGECSGKGTAYYVGGGSYEGGWKKGVKNGYGVEKYPADEDHPEYILQYEGEYRNDKRNGEGTAYYGDHTYKTAIWKDNEIEETTEEGTWK